jgi:hypothetical protein
MSVLTRPVVPPSTNATPPVKSNLSSADVDSVAYRNLQSELNLVIRSRIVLLHLRMSEGLATTTTILLEKQYIWVTRNYSSPLKSQSTT